MAQIGDDCYFFYNQTCSKGPVCKYRHVEEARGNEVICGDWRLGRCTKLACPYKHSEPPKNRQPCYYENQPGGCTRMDCPFIHQFPKAGPAGGAPVFGLQPPVTVPPNIRPGWGPSSHPPLPAGAPPTSFHSWTQPQGPPAIRPRFMPPPAPGVPFSQFRPVQQDAMYTVDQTGDKMMPIVDPVIISLNSEESDQDSIKGGSPIKPLSRAVMPPAPVKSDNPLDYFLNAKRWVDPRKRRTPSPRRLSPPRSRSRSPRSRSRSLSLSPARSISPVGRRRSVSVDRQVRRQRSHSLDRSRSQSPDARDRRRFARRSSRSPPRRDSRSPGPPRGRPPPKDLRSRLKPQVPKEPKLEEVKVTGPKIISIKKEKKEEEAVEKPEEQAEKPTEEEGFVQDEVKSLEEIYRERALKSLMDAKRKRIIEQKKKRWEGVKEKKTSESESSVKSDTDKPEEDTEDSQDQKEEEAQSESDDSEADLADDVDVEIDVGDLEGEEPEEEEDKSEDSSSEEEKKKKASAKQVKDRNRKDRKAKSSVSKVKQPSKPSIKSRLGIKALEHDTKHTLKDRIGANSNRARSIKDRLGLKASDDSAPGFQNVRSGVIRLSKSSSDSHSRVRGVRDLLARKAVKSRDKQLLLLPQITIKNNVDIEHRRAGIKQRLGLLADYDSDDSRKGHRKRNDMDEELLKLLQEEDMDIEEEDIKLLTKKEKKRLLKKLLIEHGREDEYEFLKKRKKKSKRRERDEEEERGRRRINVRARLGPSPVREMKDSEEETEDQLDSGDEIELAEEDKESEGEEIHETTEEETKQESSNTKENVPSKENDTELSKLSEEQLREKARKLKDALEPKTLEDIRKERAVKRSHGELESRRVTSGKGRRILIANDDDDAEEDTSQPKTEPPVKVTFGDEDSIHQRKFAQKTSVWSKKDKQERSDRRERQIYVPPSMKRTDGSVNVTQKTSVALKRVAAPLAGRDIVDYGDMFPKRPATTDTVAEPKAKTVKISRPVEPVPDARSQIRLLRGPPKVEVKDATVKTFAEIMAEKKRKRQLAQQESNPDRKPFKPISFDEPDLSSQDSATSVGEKSTNSLRSRLSPFEDASSNDSTGKGFKSQTVSSSVMKDTIVPNPVTVNVPQKSSNGETAVGKPSRWKRRKTNTQNATTSAENEVFQVKDKVASVSTDSISVPKTEITKKVVPRKEITEKVVPRKEITEKVVPRKEITEKVVPRKLSVDTRTLPEKSKTESEPVPEKKKKLSDSFLDLDDDFLNMDDDDLDLDLAANQDHDELMKEIDELLA